VRPVSVWTLSSRWSCSTFPKRFAPWLIIWWPLALFLRRSRGMPYISPSQPFMAYNTWWRGTSSISPMPRSEAASSWFAGKLDSSHQSFARRRSLLERTTMTKSPTDEIRAIRHQLSARFNNDLCRIVADLQLQQQESRRNFIRLASRRPRTGRAMSEAAHSEVDQSSSKTGWNPRRKVFSEFRLPWPVFPPAFRRGLQSLRMDAGCAMSADRPGRPWSGWR